MKRTENALELVAPWGGALEGDSAAAASVRQWWSSAQRVFPANTLRAWRSDWHVYDAFCSGRGVTTVPATPATVAAFVEACGKQGKKPATIRRYLTTVALA